MGLQERPVLVEFSRVDWGFSQTERWLAGLDPRSRELSSSFLLRCRRWMETATPESWVRFSVSSTMSMLQSSGRKLKEHSAGSDGFLHRGSTPASGPMPPQTGFDPRVLWPRAGGLASPCIPKLLEKVADAALRRPRAVQARHEPRCGPCTPAERGRGCRSATTSTKNFGTYALFGQNCFCLVLDGVKKLAFIKRSASVLPVGL